jgi:predicted LPLAT superfamily acyltransferase
VYWIATTLGRPFGRLIVRLIAVWYCLFGGKAVQHSDAFLEAVFQKKATLGMRYRHVLHFAQVTLDRVFLLKGKFKNFEVTTNGRHYIDEAVAGGRGAILLGAHLGSFEAMRTDEGKGHFSLNILGHFANARMINALLNRLSPEKAARVIHIEPDSVDFIFDVQERVAAGELVGTMGDRVGLNEKSVTVQFFGRPARFPTGPFVLASVLKCPVYLTFGLYHEPNRYDLYCEPFIDQLTLPRRNREAALVAVVQRYAVRLEDYCRRAPYNWFNFYDFWRGTGAAPEDPPAPAPLKA